MNKALATPIIILLIIVLGFCFEKFYAAPRMLEFREHRQITDGVIKEIRITQNKSIIHGLEYDYYVNSKLFHGGEDLDADRMKYSREYLLYKHFPVIYLDRDPSISIMLLVKEDSVEWGVQ